jgi:hypothetical protein
VLGLIRDARRRAELGARARGFVEREHRWEPLMERLAGLVESVATVQDAEMPSRHERRPVYARCAR